MRLTLTLQGPSRLMGAAPSRTLSSGSLLIGRSPVCGWVLPDPDRVVSGRHCRIDSETGRFVLTDLSTNGVFVGEAGEPLGLGGKVELRDGQVLRLGDARILVEIASDALPSAATPAGPAAPMEAPAALIADDWFAAPAAMPPSLPALPAIPEFDDLFAEELAAPPAAPADGVQRAVAEPEPLRLSALYGGLPGRDILAALDEVTARWEPEAAARLNEEMEAALRRCSERRTAIDRREIDGA